MHYTNRGFRIFVISMLVVIIEMLIIMDAHPSYEFYEKYQFIRDYSEQEYLEALEQDPVIREFAKEVKMYILYINTIIILGFIVIKCYIEFENRIEEKQSGLSS